LSTTGYSLQEGSGFHSLLDGPLGKFLEKGDNGMKFSFDEEDGKLAMPSEMILVQLFLVVIFSGRSTLDIAVSPSQGLLLAMTFFNLFIITM
jgi:hypothetical protein